MTLDAVEADRQLFDLLARAMKERFDYRNNYFLIDLLPAVLPRRRFTTPQIRTMWEREARSIADGADRQLNLFVEVPWCSSKCAYCVSPSTILPSPDALEGYCDRIKTAAKYLSGALHGTTFSTLYVGGGSPSLLSPEQVRDLFGTLGELFDLAPRGERTFESNPCDMTHEKARAIHDAGFNRVSLGVQSMDATVLNDANRLRQDKDVVSAAIEQLHAAGIDCVNCDIILGLWGETADSFIDGFEHLAALGPDSVCIYPLQPRDDYLDRFYGSDLDGFDRHLRGLSENVLPRLRQAAGRAGMTMDPVALMRPGSASQWFVGSDKARELGALYNFDDIRACSLLGLGIHSESYVFGQARYRTMSMEGDGPCGGSLFSGYVMNPGLERIHWVLRTLAARRGVPRKVYRGVFGTDLGDDLANAWRALASLDAVEDQDDEIVLLPEGPVERFVHAGFFLPREDVLRTLNRTLEDNIIDLRLVASGTLRVRIDYALHGDEGHVAGGPFRGAVVSDEEDALIMVSDTDPALLDNIGEMLARAGSTTMDARVAREVVEKELNTGS